MEFMLDTINIQEIEKYNDIIPLSGVTSNPSIVKKEGKIDFFNHMNKIREIIGKDKSLHIQVVAKDYDTMMCEAKSILHNIDKDVFIKIPVTQEGLKVIKSLKEENVNVTATAIYSKFQAYLAIGLGADYIAPYFNRMENLNIDAKDSILSMAKIITNANSSTKILAASFKNISQVNSSFENGAHCATMGTHIIKQAFNMPSIQLAIDDFAQDWESTFGENSNISTL